MATNVPTRVPDEAAVSEPGDAADDEVSPRFEPEMSPAFEQAVAAGTRTHTGEPGPDYWQQEATYDLDVQLYPDQKRLEGSATIAYTNNSPNTLRLLVLQLIQNIHAEGVPRDEFAEVTGGIELLRVAADGQELDQGVDRRGNPGYAARGTNLIVVPTNPVEPGETVELEVDWGFDIPQAGASGRMGYSRDNLFYLAYFYPKMQVYDDVIGWFTAPFRGNAEFYFGYADYDVTITAPQDWVILGTGSLQNPAEVLRPEIRARREEAYASDEPVMIMTPEDDGAVTVQDSERLTWQFEADRVRDVAYAATRESFWEAARTQVGDRDGDGTVDYTHINSIWRPSAPLWSEMTGYQQHAIRFESQYTGMPYAYPHMTAVEGTDIIGSGMEYPMMTLMGPYTSRGDSALYSVTAHELAHMWIPMMVSTNERRFSWIDEGNTTYLENQAEADYYPGVDFYDEDAAFYLQVARAGLEGPITRWSDFHYPGPAYGVASYVKPATLLRALRGLLGDATFTEAYHTFFDRWGFKHPYPADWFNTFEDVSGRDLDWFWRSYYQETWTLDQAVAGVEQTNGRSVITIENQSDAVMPAHLTITLEGGETVRREIPVDTWLSGRDAATVNVEGTVARVAIDPEEYFPDIDRSDNVWTR